MSHKASSGNQLAHAVFVEVNIETVQVKNVDPVGPQATE
jgi:hypothetical protein